MTAISPAAPAWPFRSFLFVPGNKPDWIVKARRAKPDAIILDLEDSVPPEHKKAARAIVREEIGRLVGQGIGVLVRINAVEENGLDDAHAVTVPGLTAIMLPKAGRPEQIHKLHDALSYAEGRAGLEQGSIGILLVPETAAGLVDARLLAQASPRVKSVLSGFIGGGSGGDSVFVGDTAWAAGFRPTGDGREQDYLHSKIALESRAGGAEFPVAGIMGTAIPDLDGVRHLVARAKSFGFTGAVLIHPSHVAVANEVFTPTPGQVRFAKGVIEAMRKAESEGTGAARFEGLMIDYAVLMAARQTIEYAERHEAKEHAG
jgi:citrate lyase subunit beta/citryl-CoA lyase